MIEPESKQAERRKFRALRDAIDTRELERLSDKIGRAVMETGPVVDSTLVASYSSIGSEVRTGGLHAGIRSLGADIALPRVSGDRLEFVRVSDDTPTRRSAFGIDEPGGEPVALGEIDVIIVPGIAFDRRGYRLGYGGGFYDRLLIEVSAPSIGICVDALLVDALPFDEYDQCVDRIVTDKRCWSV